MKLDTFAVPIDQRYFEDYSPGTVFEFGSITVSEEEIISFSRRYDPQPFHTDPEAAKTTMYGGLIASGWLSACLMMRLYADHYLSQVASLGSPGLDELRWVKPVRPEDTLSIRVTVTGSRRSSSKPDRGILHSYCETLNQHGEVVMTMKAINLLLCREIQSVP